MIDEEQTGQELQSNSSSSVISTVDVLSEVRLITSNLNNELSLNLVVSAVANLATRLANELQGRFPSISGTISPLWFLRRERRFGDRNAEHSTYKLWVGSFGDHNDLIVKESPKSADNYYTLQPRMEQGILRMLTGHPSFHELVTVGQSEHSMFIAVKYAGITLHDFIDHQNSEVSGIALISCYKQMLEGLQKLHELSYLHNDINLRNIYVKGGKFTLGGMKYSSMSAASLRTDIPNERLTWLYNSYGENQYNERTELCMLAYAMDNFARCSTVTSPDAVAIISSNGELMTSHLKVTALHIGRILTAVPYDRFVFNAADVSNHNGFWPPSRAFTFITLCSDYLDGIKKRYHELAARSESDPGDVRRAKANLNRLSSELEKDQVLLFDATEGWIAKVGNVSLRQLFIDKQTFDKTVRSLINAFRNRSAHHFEDDQYVRSFFRYLPGRYTIEWLKMFPQLMIVLGKWVIRSNLNETEETFVQFFPKRDDVSANDSFWAAYAQASSV